jgi:MSHA pilin protein MshA
MWKYSAFLFDRDGTIYMKQKQRGFTLIELVMVIVILGVLAAVAIPKFVDLRTDAYLVSAKGYAGALSSANAINYAGCQAKGGVVTANVCVLVDSCADLGTLLQPSLTMAVKPDPTVAGTVYVALDTATTAVGITCTVVVGDGTTAGQTATYTATTAP